MALSALKKVFSNFRYLAVAIVIALAVFLLSVWLPNLGLIWKIATSSNVSLFDKFNVMASLIGSIQTNFTAFSASYTIAVALLFGINVSIVAYYMFQRKKAMQKAGIASSAGGFVSGMFGIGCAACGTLVLGPLLALIGAGSLIAILPFGGQEFGILAVIILSASIYLTAKKIQAPLVCEVAKPLQKTKPATGQAGVKPHSVRKQEI